MQRNSEWAGCVANAAAAFATTKLGAQVSLARPEGVQAMLAKIAA
jgi:sugar/nucleoside kinase (ribokinase family)